VHAAPPFTVAVRFARTSRQAERAGGRGLVIVQHLPGLAVHDPQHWNRLDIAMDVAIAGLPVTVLCACADPAEVGTAHPMITTAAGTSVSGDYRPPTEAVIDYPPPPPPALGPPVAVLRFDVTGLTTVRRLVADVAGRAGTTPDRVADLVLAVSELASNSVEHGPGAARLRLWTGPGVVAELCDVLQVWSGDGTTVVRVAQREA
jgi:hypothetical protein